MTADILSTLQRGGILKFSPHSQAFYLVHNHQDHHADQAEAKRLVKREIVRPNGMAAEGHPTPSGEPSPEWLEVLRLATLPTTQAAPAAMQCVECNSCGSAFDIDTYMAGYTDGKGHCLNCPGIDHDAPQAAPAAQGDAEDAARWRVINEQFIDDYLEDYELVGEAEGVGDCSYTPTETERDLIKDAILGLLSCAEDAARSQAKEGGA